MKPEWCKRVGIFLLAIVMAFGILASCTAPQSSTLVQQAATGTVPVNSPSLQPVLKTGEIFDAQKYAGQFTIRYFNADVQGTGGDWWDSMLVQTPDGVNMLIDSGLEPVGPKVIEYLKKLGVKKLDYAVATHLHTDHIGGYVSILNEIPVDTLMMPNFTAYNSSIAKKFLGTINAAKAKVEYAKAGTAFQLGKDVKVEVLNPEMDIKVPENVVPEKDIYFINNMSIVLKMTYKQRTFLFTGDIYKDQEFKMVEQLKEKLDADVVKAPHHGSNTSSSLDFVEAVSPKVTIMTSLSPGKEAYDKYRRAGSEVYITGHNGTVLVVSDGDKINVICEKERDMKGYYN